MITLKIEFEDDGKGYVQVRAQGLSSPAGHQETEWRAVNELLDWIKNHEGSEIKVDKRILIEREESKPSAALDHQAGFWQKPILPSPRRRST